MGAYLSTPITDKESEEGGDAKYSFGVCAMQGWRTDMEDSHIINLNVDDAQKGQVALFGVFDGHGGKEVAKFCAAHIADALKATEGYKKGDYADALRQTFLDMDVIMTREEHMAELEAYRKGSDDEEGGPDGSLKKGETAMMLDSAQLPEAFLDAFGISRDSGYVFKVVKSADGQLNVQNVLDSEGNELGPGEDMEEEDADADPQADPLDVVDEAVEKHTPLQLEEMNSEEEAWTGPQAGCTAVCAMVLGNQLVVANAGDSRCVLSRKGQAVALTEDHKPTNDEEFDRICKAGGFVADGRVNGSLNLSRALGDLEYKSATHVRRRFRFRPPPTRPSRPSCPSPHPAHRTPSCPISPTRVLVRPRHLVQLPPEEQMVTADPEIRTMELTPDDEFLILACDGIWDVLTNQEAVEFVRTRLMQGMTPIQICEAACDFCLAEDTSGCGKGCDNMSIVVSVLKESRFAKALTKPL